MILNEHSSIAYNRFVNPDYNTGFEDDGRIFVKALPSPTPVTPGSNKPMISRSPFVPKEDSPHYKALDKISKQGFRVSSAFIDYISSIFPKGGEQRLKWQDAIERSFLGLWRKRGQVLYCDAFYDWRGRVYHMSGEWGSLQNNRLSRASLSAPDKYRVEPEGYAYMIKIFKHEGWATTVEEATDYLAAPDFDGDGALDWMAVRAALTIIEISKTGMTDYLLEQDATCSGFQHMALLMRDKELAKTVNAVKSDVNGDLYMLVADEGKIAEMLFGGNRRKARSFAKTIVMLTGYGSGATGIACNYWLDHGGDGEIDDEGRMIPDEESTIHIGNKEFTYTELKSFVKERQAILMDKFPSIKTLRKECIKWYSACMHVDASKFVWLTPDEFVALRLISQVEQDNNMVGAAGAMPNMIHSLDAAVVRYVILNFSGVLGVVHDAFFTNINDALKLRTIVQDGYVHIHSNLDKFPINNNRAMPEIGRCIGVM